MNEALDNIDLNEIYVYQISMPNSVKEFVRPSFCGYTIYINQNLTYEQQKSAYTHALLHIKNRDFEKNDVQEIEYEAHQQERGDEI